MWHLVNSFTAFAAKLYFLNLERIDNEKYFCPFYGIESLNLRNSFIDNDINFIFKSSSLFKTLFINLKELYFYTYVTKLNFKIFDEFTNLSKLYLRKIIITEDTIINLPNLKDLSILSDYSRDYTPTCCRLSDVLEPLYLPEDYGSLRKRPTYKFVTIRSKIKKIKLNNYFNNDYKFEHPELIEELEILDYRTIDITQFPNLKVLKLYSFYGMNRMF